ncbi:MAG: uroporphyrinogen decarboxylase family protein [Anaerolineae bacterium]
MSMTSRQRITRALQHREPDRTPLFEYVMLSPLADLFLGHIHAGDPDNWARLEAELGWRQAVRQFAIDILDLALRLGHDMLYVIPNWTAHTDHPVIAAGKPIPDDPVERLQMRNQAQADSPAGLSDERLLVYSDLLAEMRRRELDLPILAPAYTHGIWTDTDLMQTMILAPEVAHEHFRLATRQALAMTERYLELGIDQIGVGGDIAGNDPLISPVMYRDFIMPEVRQVAQRIHQAGAWAITASDGNLWSIIDDWLLGCEVDGYLEIDFHAGMDLALLKPRFGQRITFYGNMDPGLTLSFASPDEVRQATIACLQAGSGQGGHVFCTSNAITASVPPANYLAMLAAYRDFFGLLPLEL